MTKTEHFRRTKKEQGFEQANVYFGPEERKIIETQANATGLTKSEIIRIALRTAYPQETETRA